MNDSAVGKVRLVDRMSRPVVGSIVPGTGSPLTGPAGVGRALGVRPFDFRFRGFGVYCLVTLASALSIVIAP